MQKKGSRGATTTRPRSSQANASKNAGGAPSTGRRRRAVQQTGIDFSNSIQNLFSAIGAGLTARATELAHSIRQAGESSGFSHRRAEAGLRWLEILQDAKRDNTIVQWPELLEFIRFLDEAFRKNSVVAKPIAMLDDHAKNVARQIKSADSVKALKSKANVRTKDEALRLAKDRGLYAPGSNVSQIRWGIYPALKIYEASLPGKGRLSEQSGPKTVYEWLRIEKKAKLKEK